MEIGIQGDVYHPLVFSISAHGASRRFTGFVFFFKNQKAFGL
jgi:hypothetical protein